MSMLVALLAAAATDADPRVLRLDADAPFVDAVIADRPVRLRVDTGAHEEVLLDRTTAERLRLTTAKRELAGLIGWRPAGDMGLSIGPVKIDGRWAEEVMRFGAKHNDIFPILADMIRWRLDLPSRHQKNAAVPEPVGA